MFKLKIDDEVLITAGRDKGKKGKIQKILATEDKIIVPQINVYKRHRKATTKQKAGIYEIARPINFAQVSLICPKCSKQTRVSFKLDGKEKKRICAKCKGVIV